jgi:hypothetical protein
MNLCLRYEDVALLSFTEPMRWNDRIFFVLSLGYVIP